MVDVSRVAMLVVDLLLVRVLVHRVLLHPRTRSETQASNFKLIATVVYMLLRLMRPELLDLVSKGGREGKNRLRCVRACVCVWCMSVGG
jgi:hypothetical protein